MADRDNGKPDDPAGQMRLEHKQISLTKPQLEGKDVAPTVKTKWNTKNLALRWAADIASASCAAGLVAPLISIIDRYVTDSVPRVFPAAGSSHRDQNTH